MVLLVSVEEEAVDVLVTEMLVPVTVLVSVVDVTVTVLVTLADVKVALVVVPLLLVADVLLVSESVLDVRVPVVTVVMV